MTDAKVMDSIQEMRYRPQVYHSGKAIMRSKPVNKTSLNIGTFKYAQIGCSIVVVQIFQNTNNTNNSLTCRRFSQTEEHLSDNNKKDASYILAV